MSAIADRLQKEVERFTDKLERERRAGLILDEDIKAARETLQGKISVKRETHKVRLSNGRDAEKVKELENILQVAKKNLSSLATSNLSLRSQIDTIRQSTRTSLSISNALSQSLLDVTSQVETAQVLTSRTQKAQTTLQSRISSMRNSFELEQSFAHRKHSSIDISEKKIRKLKRRVDFTETFQGEIWAGKDLVRSLQAKWVRLASEKRKELARYLEYTDDLTTGFQKIMDKESFSNHQQIATVAINAIESQKALEERLIYLREQAEILKVSLTASQDGIMDLSTNNESSSFISNSKRTRIKTNLSNMTHRTEAANEKLGVVRREVEKLMEPVVMLKELGKQLGVDELVRYEEEFSMETAKSHMSQLEPWLGQLLLLLHPKRVKPSPYPVSHFFITEQQSSAPTEVAPPNLTTLLESVDSSLLGAEPSRPLKFAEFRLRAQHVVGKLPV